MKRRNLLAGIILLALIGVLGVSPARAGTNYDLALWRFFLIKVDSNYFSRDQVEFLGGSANPFMVQKSDGTQVSAFGIKVGNDVYVWKSGKYVLCSNANNNVCNEANIDATKSLEVVADQDSFKVFAKAWSALWAPSIMSPAESLGISGYDIGVESSLNFLTNANDPAWASGFTGYDPVANSYPPSMLPVVKLHFRKGLPYSTELGLHVDYLIGSQLLALGMEFKFAIYEGFDNAPDIDARFVYGHVFGSPQMSSDYYGGDLAVSYEFGLGGLLQLTPYGGYSMVAMVSTPVVQNVSFHTKLTGCSGDYCADYDGPLVYLSPETVLLHRFFVGTRLIITHFVFGLEYVFTADGGFAPQNNTLTIKLGGDF